MVKSKSAQALGTVVFSLAAAASLITSMDLYAQGQRFVDQSHSASCKYQKLWLDPAGDGSPMGRDFVHKLGEIVRKSNAVELVDKKEDAQAVFADQVIVEHEAPSNNANINCTTSEEGTDCYSDNYHAHADESGSYVAYTGPTMKTYGWALFDRKTFMLLDSYGKLTVDFKHPDRVASQILRNLGCRFPPSVTTAAKN